jgi:serine/threonine protein kinase
MNETLPLIDETVPEIDLEWQQRLDELVRGECSEDAFMIHVLNLREAGPYTAWNVVALLDQRYRRGQLPAEMFRSIESKIAQYELADIDYGTTIDLPPAPLNPQAAVPIRRVTAAAPPRSAPGPTASTPPILAAAVAATPAAVATAPEVQASPPVLAAAIPVPQAPTPDPPATVTGAPPAVERAVGSVPEIGSKLRNRYVIERRLGTGGMGTVFKALDHYRCDLPEGDRYVAMKFLHHRTNGRPEILSDLRREFYCAQTLSHPNIVKVYELDQDDDFVFFTMEFLEGELLSGAIERLMPRKLSKSSAWTLIQGMAAGVVHAHSRNVVHADLKPHNIMITSLGEVRILDFGAASSAARRQPDGEANQKGNSTALTPAYASCELLESKTADARDDLYALACVSYELLAGEHPFQRRRSTEARDQGLVARRPEGLTRTQWNALARGLSWQREDRSISVSDWLAQMNPPADTPVRLSLPLGLQPIAEPLKLMSAPTPIPVPTPIPASAPIRAQSATSGPKSASAARSTSAANPPSTVLRVVAALALVVLAFGLWLSLNRRSMETTAVPTIATADTPVVADMRTAADPSARPSISPDVFAPQPPAPLPLSSAAVLSLSDGASANGPSTLDAPAPGPQSTAESPPAKSDAAEGAAHKARVNAISLSAGVYRVRPRQNFAELHLYRTPGSVGSSSFVWWTEPATAAAGLDYVPQARITQLLPAGSRAASLFIRLLPNASRRHSAVFYVVIGEPGNGVALGRVARTAVILPPSGQ